MQVGLLILIFGLSGGVEGRETRDVAKVLAGAPGMSVHLSASWRTNEGWEVMNEENRSTGTEVLEEYG